MVGTLDKTTDKMARTLCQGIISTLLVLCQIYETGALCPDKWIHFQGFCFHFSSHTSTWINARKRCLELDADLAMVGSEADNARLISVASGSKCQHNASTWIGLHLDPQNTSRWVWSTGQVIRFKKWHPMVKETVYERDKNCTELRPSVSDFWYKNVCSQNNYYVCKNDADECMLRGTCGEHRCINARGSYKCECKEGYSEQLTGQKCSDIDECSQANGGCPHTCINTHGSFICQCQDGYVRSNNGTKCDPVISNNRTSKDVPLGGVGSASGSEGKNVKEKREESKSTNLGMLVAMGIPLCVILCFLILCYMKGPGTPSHLSRDGESDCSNQEALLTSSMVSTATNNEQNTNFV